MTTSSLKLLGQRVFKGIIGLAVILIVLEFAWHHYHKVETDAFPLFYAIFSFVVAFLIVGAGYLLKTLLARRENYYDE